MRRWFALLPLVLGLPAHPSCASNSAEGGNSNWLRTCDTADDCGDGLGCLCGLCTIECAGSSECSALLEGAVCDPTGSGAWEGQCGGEGAPGGICVKPCRVNSDCGIVDLECRAGSCVPIDADASPEGGVSEPVDSGTMPDVSVGPDAESEPPEREGGRAGEPVDASAIPTLPVAGEPCEPGGIQTFVADGGVDVSWQRAPACRSDLRCDAQGICRALSPCGASPSEECAFGQGDVRDVAIDGQTLYWVDYGTFDRVANYQNDGALRARTVGDDGSQVIAGGLDRPMRLWVGADRIVMSLEDRSCHQVPRDGSGAPQLIAKDCGVAGALAGNYFFYPYVLTVARVDLSATAPVPVLMDEGSDAGGSGSFRPLFAEGAELIVSTHSWLGLSDVDMSSMVRLRREGAESIALAQDDVVFVPRNDPTVVRKIPKAGGSALNVGGLLGRVDDVHVYDAQVHFTMTPSSPSAPEVSIVRAPVDLSEFQEELVRGGPRITAFDVDAVGLFWVDADGRIRFRPGG